MFDLRKLLFLLLFLSFSVMADESQRQSMRFNHLNDYTHGTPRAITRDSYGFLWIGTIDGLLKYDGYNYTHYTPEQSNDFDTSGREIRKILSDSKKNLWVGTVKGLKRYDYRTNKFESISLPGNQYIFDILEAKDGSIWIATEGGVLRYYNDSVTHNFNTYVDLNGINRDELVARTIYQDIDENIWIGSTDKGLFRVDYLENVLLQHFDNSSLDYVIGISEIGANELLISTFKNGIYRVNKISSEINEIQLPYTDVEIRSSIKTSNGEHWIATNGKGILALSESALYTMMESDADDRSLLSDDLYTIYEDDENNIWVGTTDNISYVQIHNVYINNYFVDGTSSGLTGSNIFSIYKNSEGVTYFGSYREGIDRLDSSGKVTNIRLVSKQKPDETITASVNDILSKDNELWVASSRGLLYSSDEQKFELISINENDTGAVLNLYQLNKSEILIGTRYSLYKYDTELRKLLTESSVTGEIVREIVEHNNYYWAVTDENIYKLNDSLVPIDKISLKELGLLSASSIVFLDEKRIVVGTMGAGAAIVDVVSKKVIHSINEQTGLDNNVIYGLLMDNQRNVWLATHRGLSVYNTVSQGIVNLHIQDGFQSEEYNLGAVFKDTLGKLYFGGTKGVTSFYPQRILKDSRTPNVLWSRFETVVDGSFVYGLPTDSNLSGEINTTLKISLAYDDYSNIEFSSDSILNSDWVKFQTRENSTSESDWIGIRSDDRQIKISPLLPTGTHKFDVRASHNGIDWSEPLSLEINKSPPPWQTWWAYLSYFFLVASIIGYFFKLQFQKNQEKMRSQKLIRDSEERLKLALWGSRDELWDWNLISGKIHRSNTWGILSFPKRDTDEHGSNTLFRNIHPKDLPSVRASLDDHRNGYTTHYEATYRIKDKEGNWIWILDRGKIVEHDKDGNPLRMSGTIRNISDIRDTQEQLDLIAKAFENTSDGVFILDNHFKYQAVNKSYEKITGFKFADKKDKLFEIQSSHTSSKDVLHKVRQSLVLEGAWQGELEDTRASGEGYTIELKLDAVRDRLDEITHFVGVFSDITYRKKAEQDLRRMANYDQLTGLPNRSLFQDRLKHAIALSDRSNKELILLFIDLDNFKIVNDSLGHSIGDRLLTKVAERISACVRSNDTVARLGGDEYTILLEQVEGSFVGTRVADKILDALSRPFRIQGHELVIGCSIGIAMYPDDGADVETLLRNADTAMYSAKYQNKNNYQFFTDSMNKKANSRLEMEHELRKAIPAGDIKVVYQPKVDLTTGRIMGCEALARWSHPELGFVSPEDFIALAEETGLIYTLGESVLNQACRATAEWKKHHGYTGRTAVNLSAIQFRQTGLLDNIDSIVHKHGLTGSDIELELTEGMLVTNPESVNQIMSDFRSKDYHLSIDDFGTGYASMAQLKKFPINTLKIDKTFIDDVTKDEQDASLVKAVLSLAQNLNLSTVAEGVEYEEQVEILNTMGCESIQGYVYSKPISANLFASLLESNLTLNEVIKRNNEKIINFPA